MALEDVVLYLARSLAREPDEVSVHAIAGQSSILLELRTSPDDRPRILGPDRKNFHAMQQVVTACGERLKPVLDLVEADAGSYEE